MSRLTSPTCSRCKRMGLCKPCFEAYMHKAIEAARQRRGHSTEGRDPDNMRLDLGTAQE